MNTDHAERPETASRRPGGRVRRRGERGQSLVELALMLPVILFLLVGVVEVGNALNAYLTVVDGARDGARLGSKGAASDADIKALVVTETERLASPVADSDITITRDYPVGAAETSAIKVEVCYDHPLILDVLDLVPNPLRMCSTTAMPRLVLPGGS